MIADKNCGQTFCIYVFKQSFIAVESQWTQTVTINVLFLKTNFNVIFSKNFLPCIVARKKLDLKLVIVGNASRLLLEEKSSKDLSS